MFKLGKYKIIAIFIAIFAIGYLTTACAAVNPDHINELTYKYGKTTFDDPRAPKASQNSSIVEFESFHRFRFNDYVNVTGEMAFYHYPETFNATMARYTDKEDIVALNELLLNINLTEHITFSAGQIPAHDGAYNSIKTNNIVKSELLYTVVDNAGQGSFLSYENNYEGLIYKAKFGKVEAATYPFDNDKKYESRLEGTNGTYLLGILEYERYQLIYNHIDMEVRTDDMQYLDSKVDALGFKIDDTDRSGFLGYGIFSQSDTDGIDSVTVRHPVFPININLPLNLDGKGESMLLGLKYTFDAFKFENFVGYEYYTANQKNMVFNNGAPNSEYGLGILGDSHTYYIGTNITPKFNVSLQHKVTDYEYVRSLLGTNALPDTRTDKGTMIVAKYLF